jgi:putative nucleotide-binding protein containing TIR-like domain
MDKSKVFIVHGHDGEAKEAVARFVEKIGLEAIILHEQASSGNTIIEKIEANSNVGFAIVLYTPCDEGASKGKKDQLKPRARQNVVFEHGYLIGKIGRKNVSALVKGDIETPTDISGVVYIKMDEGEAWKYQVAKEMKACGYEFDPSKLLE